MMLKLTKKCSMGCKHCMNDAKPVEQHMSWETLKKSVRFLQKYTGPFCLISGGEPTEHPEFPKMFDYIMDNLPDRMITLTTNGIWLQDKEDFIDYIFYHHPLVEIQVSSVPGLYPELVDESMPLFSKKYAKHVLLCREIPRMYPQGRAVTNNLPPGPIKGCKCFNIRAIVRQEPEWGLAEVIGLMAAKALTCTPHISYDGSIRVGESDLCPVCSHIDKTEQEILEDIRNFDCHRCAFINEKVLSEEARAIIGE